MKTVTTKLSIYLQNSGLGCFSGIIVEHVQVNFLLVYTLFIVADVLAINLGFRAII